MEFWQGIFWAVVIGVPGFFILVEAIKKHEHWDD